MTGGLVQPGNAQCLSRQTRARHSAGVTSRWARPTSRTSPRVPSATGMMSASQARRRTVAGESSRPSSAMVVQSIRPCSASRLVVTATRGRAPCASGGRSVARACSQVSTRASQSRAPWSRTSSTSPQSRRRPGRPGCGLVSGSRAALTDGVLHGPAAAEPDAAGAVLDDGEEPAVVGGAVLAARSFSALRSARSGSTTWMRGVRPWPGRWRAAAPPRRGGSSRPAPACRIRGQLLDGVADHPRLLRRDQAVAQRVPRERPFPGQCARAGHRNSALPGGAGRAGRRCPRRTPSWDQYFDLLQPCCERSCMSGSWY